MGRWQATLGAALIVFSVSRSGSTASTSVLADPAALVTLDGVRRQEIFEGTEPARSHAPRIAAPDC
jgi:hypothetical protein